MNGNSNRLLNIVYVGKLPPQGYGATLTCGILLAGLAGLGHKVGAISPITPEETGRPDPFAVAHPEISVSRYPMPCHEMDPSAPASDDFRRRQAHGVRSLVGQLVARDRPDVILIGRESDVWQVPRLAKEHTLPCVLMMHGAILWIFDGSFPRDLGRQLLEQAGATDLVVACAEHMAKTVRQVGFENVETIPNGVDTGRFVPGPRPRDLMRNLRICDDETVVLHVSALHPVKRPLDLVASAEQALRDHTRLVYVIVGDSPWRPPVEEACAQLGLSDRFRFVGQVDPVDMPEYFRLADMVVMPSRSEGLARVYLEAQASGRVLLASDIPAAREVISDGETGLLFRMGDIQELSAKTVYAARRPELRATIGRQARGWVERRHRLEDAVSRWGVILAEVVNRCASRGIRSL